MAEHGMLVGVTFDGANLIVDSCSGINTPDSCSGINTPDSCNGINTPDSCSGIEDSKRFFIRLESAA